jgi:hypothetical protein
MADTDELQTAVVNDDSDTSDDDDTVAPNAHYRKLCVSMHKSVPRIEVLLLSKLLSAGYLLESTTMKPWLCGICTVERGKAVGDRCACSDGGFMRWSHARRYIYDPLTLGNNRWIRYENLARELELRGYDFREYIEPWVCAICELDRNATLIEGVTCACEKKTELNPQDANERDFLYYRHSKTDYIPSNDKLQMQHALDVNEAKYVSRVQQWLLLHCKDTTYSSYIDPQLHLLAH